MDQPDILKPNYKFDGWVEDDFIQAASIVADQKVYYPLLLGKLAFHLETTYGGKALEHFATSISEMTGRKVNPKSLNKYRWIYARTKDLPIPEDFSFRAIRMVAEDKDPTKAIKQALDKGWSSEETIFHLSQLVPKKEKIIICPSCKKPFVYE